MNEATTTGEQVAEKKKIARSMGEIRVYEGDGTDVLGAVYHKKGRDGEDLYGSNLDGEGRTLLAFPDSGAAEKWIRDHGEDGATYSIVAFKGSRTVEVEVVETRRIK